MNIPRLQRELERLMEDISQRTGAFVPSQYTKGYLDALRYILEWIEEEDEE